MNKVFSFWIIVILTTFYFLIGAETAYAYYKCDLYGTVVFQDGPCYIDPNKGIYFEGSSRQVANLVEYDRLARVAKEMEAIRDLQEKEAELVRSRISIQAKLVREKTKRKVTIAKYKPDVLSQKEMRDIFERRAGKRAPDNAKFHTTVGHYGAKNSIGMSYILKRD